MKFIQKTNPPESFSTWYHTQQAQDPRVNFNFKSLQNPEKSDLHNTLVEEQGFLCAYTMKRISKNDSHLEHIRPQHDCPDGEGIDLDYHNLLACYPQGNSKTKCPFGAHFKDKWWQNEGRDFISPLNDACELKFCYTLDGEVFPTNEQFVHGAKTIEILKLDEASLTNDRKKSIEEFIFGEEPISPEQADEAISEIYKPNSEGVLPEFCIAIHDALYEYLDMFPKIAETGG